MDILNITAETARKASSYVNEKNQINELEEILNKIGESSKKGEYEITISNNISQYIKFELLRRGFSIETYISNRPSTSIIKWDI